MRPFQSLVCGARVMNTEHNSVSSHPGLFAVLLVLCSNTEHMHTSSVTHTPEATAMLKCSAITKLALGDKFCLIKVRLRCHLLHPSHSRWTEAEQVDVVCGQWVHQCDILHACKHGECHSGHKAWDQACTTEYLSILWLQGCVITESIKLHNNIF